MSLPDMSLPEQAPDSQELDDAERDGATRRYPAPSLEEVRRSIRDLGVQDPDRLLPTHYYGELANYT